MAEGAKEKLAETMTTLMRVSVGKGKPFEYCKISERERQ